MKPLKFFFTMIALLTLLLVACSSPDPVAPTEPAEQIEATDEPEPTEEVAPTDEPEPTEAAVEEIAAPTANLTDGCVVTYDENVDYFPEKMTVDEASGLEIEYFNNYKVINVTNPWRDAEQTFQYVLVQCGTPAPDGFDDALIIEVPVETVISMSTTQLPHLDELGEIDSLVGLDGFAYVSNEVVRAKIDAGELQEIGSGAEVNVEVTLDLNPDLVMTYGSGSPDYDTHPVLLQANIPTVLNSEYMEGSPLGRAEWIKFTAAFFNKEEIAQAVFADQQARYDELVALTAAVDERPTVFSGTPYGDTWYMPGGGSYVAAFLEDAGTTYLWADDDSTGSIPLDFEVVFERAVNADYWLNPGVWQSLEDGVAEDSRYAEFAAFQNGHVFNNNLRLNENGGNEYWELGVTNPQLVLADLVKIFHPELLPDHEFVFYQDLGEGMMVDVSEDYAVTVTNCGLEITYDAAPTRAVTMNQAATEIMLALGLEDSMIGTAYLDDAILPELADAYNAVPVMSEQYPSQEVLFGSEPDFVYGVYRSAFGDEAAGPRVELLGLEIGSYLSEVACEDEALRPEEATFDVVYGEIRDIGRIFGIPERAEALIADMQAELDGALASLSDEDPFTVLWYDSGADLPFVGACCGTPNMIIEAVGGENIFADTDGNWAEVSWEAVLERNPDVIVVVDASWDPAQDKIDLLFGDPLYSTITAVQEENIVVIPFSATTLGVRNAAAVTTLANGLAE